MGDCGLNIGNSLHNGAEVWEDNFRGEDNAFGRSSGKGLGFFFPSRAGSTLLLAVSMLFAGTIFSSVMVLHFERGAESANINTYFDALWWAAETVSWGTATYIR